MNIMLMTGISFIVGLSISGQTFYTFILENLDKFGALKAIGTSGRVLVSMILFQATFTALTGYGLGVGLCDVSNDAGKDAAPRLRCDAYLSKSSPCPRHGRDHRWVLQLHRRPQSSPHRAIRYLPRIAMPTLNSTVAIKAEGITKWFGEGEARTAALRDVNLEMRFGEMIYVVGPSGSGKTTLLSVLSGILRPTPVRSWPKV